jgi:hypothetical protein
MRSARARKVNTLPSRSLIGNAPERSAWIVAISARRFLSHTTNSVASRSKRGHHSA